MANKLTLQHKRSSTGGNSPTSSDLAVGELAINFADKKIYTKDNSNNIVLLSATSDGAWQTEASGISRVDRIKVGSNTNPSSAVDIDGAIVSNKQTTTGVIDISTGQIWEFDGTSGGTISFTGSITGSTTVVLKVTTGDGGTITWPSSVKWSGGTAPVLSSGVDVITFITPDSGTNWYGNHFAQDAQ